MLGSARAPAQAVPARQANRKSRPARPRSSAGRVTAKKDDYVPGMYISQSQMELRLLEKLLKDKRKELAAYDLQLDEYMKIVAQTQRSLIPSALKPSTPSAGAVSARSSASVSLTSNSGPEATRDILDRLLAEKQTELMRLQQDVELYKREVSGSSYALGYTPGASGVAGSSRSAKRMLSPAPKGKSEAELRAERLTGMSDYAKQRLAELEGLMSGELEATRQQIRRNEELRLKNDAQLRANQMLAEELLGGRSASMEETFAKPSSMASEISNTRAVEAALAKAGAKGPVPKLNMPPMQVPAPAPPVPQLRYQAPVTAKIPTTPAAEEAARNFRKAVAEQPSLFASEPAAAPAPPPPPPLPPLPPMPEPSLSTEDLDEMVAKSAAMSRAAANFTKPGLAPKKKGPWGPEVVLLGVAAAVEAAVDFGKSAIEVVQLASASSAPAAAAPPAAAPTAAAAAAAQEDDTPKEVLSEGPQPVVPAAEEGGKEPPNFGKLWSQKRKQGGA